MRVGRCQVPEEDKKKWVESRRPRQTVCYVLNVLQGGAFYMYIPISTEVRDEADLEKLDGSRCGIPDGNLLRSVIQPEGEGEK